MPPNPDVQARIDRLDKQLSSAGDRSSLRAKGNYWISLLLMLIAVSASVVAGIGGLSKQFGPQVTGALALIPGAIALVASNLKFQDKSSWHYRRLSALEALRSRLLLQLPEAPTVDDVASIAKDRDAMEERMQKEWDEKFSFNFAVFETKKDGTANVQAP